MGDGGESKSTIHIQKSGPTSRNNLHKRMRTKDGTSSNNIEHSLFNELNSLQTGSGGGEKSRQTALSRNHKNQTDLRAVLQHKSMQLSQSPEGIQINNGVAEPLGKFHKRKASNNSNNVET